ncbi:hypothetical protein IWW50_005294 [Coemansia erecta]|nr:hypothetical protein IWW50_005294 [Coemansia erecta]
MDDEGSALSSPSNWPRRRNPIPASLLYGTPSHQPTQAQCTEGSDTWDTDTVRSRTPSPSMLASCDSIGTLVRALKSKERMIHDLGKEVETHERSVQAAAEQMGGLQRELAASSRRERASAGECTRMRWELGQCEKQHEGELQRLAHKYAGKVHAAEEQGRRAAEDLALRLAELGAKCKGQARQISGLVRERRVLRLKVDQAQVARATLADRLGRAELAAVRAREDAAAGCAALGEHRRYIAELEQRLGEMAPLAALLGPGVAGGLDVGEMSLFVEISKATDSVGALPAPPLNSDARIEAPTSPLYSDARIETPTSPLCSDANRPEGPLYWAAVCLHMLWALYLRLFVQPVLRMALAMFRRALGFVVPEMLLRINIAMLLPNAKAAS